MFLKVPLNQTFEPQPNLRAITRAMIISLNLLEFRMARTRGFNDPRYLTGAFIFSGSISLDQAEVFKTASMSQYIQCFMHYW